MTNAAKRKDMALAHSEGRKKPAVDHTLGGRVEAAISIAEGKGLMRGGRTRIVRGRMPAALVEEAKQKTGITSDSKLLEAALANMVVADDYGDWLISQRRTVNPELDLEF